MKKQYIYYACVFVLILCNSIAYSQYQVEKLNRGIVAVRTGTNNFISWRWLGTEDDNITFNLYRNGTKVNTTPLTVCNYTDAGAAANSQYYVRAIVNNLEQPQSEIVSVWGQQYLSIPLQIPAGGTTPDNVAYTYEANDCSIGDVDGDGIYEIFLKWYPTNAKDNSQSGYTGNCLIDCYKLNGTRLWRIDLGRNIRSGSHYTQFMVYDFDGDGKAEMACKTADATKDAAGTIIGNANADYRNSSGYILSGPEFLTMFNGETGKIMQTIDYVPLRGTVSSWGDNYGNRVDRFLAGVAYFDGKKPSLVSCRGYYTRAVIVAWDWVNGAFVRRWTFDSNVSGSQYTGQGDHSLSIGDVDNDGKQEVIYGAMVIDDNGSPLYNTTFGHGDALHVSDFDPNNPGLEIFNIQERDDDDDCYLYSALQKRIIWKKGATGGEGPGRGAASNISDNSAGAEFWVAGGQGLTGAPWNPTGGTSGLAGPASCNFLIWWDGDLARELQNGTVIDKHGTGRLFTGNGVSSNNGTKSTPNLSGDILGDWREELILRTSDNTALRIYTTVAPSNFKIRTLVHDAQYRVALAWQNTAYNQPPHPSFYLGTGVALPTKPNIVVVGATNALPTVEITSPTTGTSFNAPATITLTANATDTDGSVTKVDFYNGATLLGSDATSPYTFSWTSVAAGTYIITAVVTDNKGATATSAPISLTVITPSCSATATAGGPTTFCQGSSVILTASSGTAYQWKNGTTNVGTGQTYTATTSGSYTVEVTCSNNAKGTSTPIVVTVNPIVTWYADSDGDGVGVSSSTVSSCTQPVGYVSTAGDLCPTDANKTAPGDCGCGKLEGTCTDCNGVINGSATVDICDRCVGGTTGKTACNAISEAEVDTCKLIGIVESLNEGFSGDGYVNTNNTTTSYFEFNVYSNSAINGTLSFRYANGGTTDRPAQILVNGTALANNLSMPTTGAWNDWSVIEVTIPLIQGVNKIRLVSTTASGLANIDQIGFVSSGISRAGCIVTKLDATSLANYGISVFPNPSTDNFNIDLPIISNVKIISAQGSEVWSQNQVKHIKFGDELATGIYSVLVTSQSHTYIFNIVKE